MKWKPGLFRLAMFVIMTTGGFSAEVKGVVRDSTTDTVLAGVSVVLKGTTTHTITDAAGRFSLTVNGTPVTEEQGMTAPGTQADFTLNGRTLCWSAGPDAVVRLHTLQGVLLARRRATASFMLPQLADGIYLVEIEKGGKSQIGVLVRAGDFASLGSLRQTALSSCRQAKAAAGAALVFNRYHYIGKEQNVTDGDTNLVIKMRVLTHGDQLTKEMVGPAALGVANSQLKDVNPNGERLSTWPGNGRPSWIPGTPYVYNNDPANHGGVVPAGGMMIDDFFVPAGVWVSQFHNYKDGLIILGDNDGQSPAWPGVVFRGCRSRDYGSDPGFINDWSPSNTGKWWILFCEFGASSADNVGTQQIPLKSNHFPAVFCRTYISYFGTGIHPNWVAGIEILENYIEKFEYSPGSHINGISTGGGTLSLLIERNWIVAETPDEMGNPINQTDCIAIFQDFGPNPGSGTNSDGTTGIRIINNYLGGTGYCIYAGAGSGICNNVAVIGNKVTTRYWQNGAQWGPIAAEPAWGSGGNVKSNNTWADDYGTGTGLSGRQYPNGDGPRAGQTW